MRIMTFNLLFDGGEGTPFSWDHRRDVALEIARRYRPHVLGTQEGMARQLDYLAAALAPEYAMVSEGRTWDDTSQYPTLFFRTEDLELVRGDEFWLSETPRVHLSKNRNSAFPRMMSCALFRERPSGREFQALVTHLDHLGQEARLEQANLAGFLVALLDRPCILLGDFNDEPGSAVHRALTGGICDLTDTWQALSGEETVRSMTRHDGEGRPKKFRMDWILHSPEFVTEDAVVIRDNRAGLYPSDHYPYLAEIAWKEACSSW